tara:strand:+ start:102472 stop:103536 length:1065 start_codon:yes stop_codon:yes gene_type:complete
MSGNTIGKIFTVTTAGESHGPALVAIVDGCPAGLALSEADMQPDLDRRKPGQSKFTTQRREDDVVKILSGVFEGKTTGTPIALLIENTDQRSKDYSEIKDKFRPGHADYAYSKKYGVRDYRGGGRASARVTAMVVAAGAIAKKYLHEQCGMVIQGYVSQIGDIKPETIDLTTVEHNPFFFPDASKLQQLEKAITNYRRDGDSIGAKVTVQASHVPAGLGEPVFDKLDAEIAYAMMGINAVKAVELGAGVECVTQRGSEHRDEITSKGFQSNHSGGTLGGISSGQDIIAHLSLKPTSSITTPANTLDEAGNETQISTKGRHDPCVGIRAVPIAEGMLAIVLMDHYLRQLTQNHAV